MELKSCSNCLAVYGDIQDECPMCGADHDGDGAQIALDSATRTAIQRFGGIYGGILEGPGGSHVLWCSRGVCLIEDRIGLAWGANAFGQVDDVSVGDEEIVVTAGGERRAFLVVDGSEVE